MQGIKLAVAAAFMLTSTQVIAATVGIFGTGGHGPGYATVLTEAGHTPVYISAVQSTDAFFLAGIDVLIISRRAGTPEIKTYVQNGGSLITEWSAAEWVFNDAGLLVGDAQIGYSPSTFIGTDTPINFTAAGLAAGLGNGLSNSFSDAGATQFFWPMSNLGTEIDILATRADGTPVIVAGDSGAGNVLVMAHDWNDRDYDPTDGIILNEQLLLNAVAYLPVGIAPVPLPASLPLLLGGISLLAIARRKHRS